MHSSDVLQAPGRPERLPARTGGKPTPRLAQRVRLRLASSAFFVERAGAPASEGDWIDASTCELLEDRLEAPGRELADVPARTATTLRHEWDASTRSMHVTLHEQGHKQV